MRKKGGASGNLPRKCGNKIYSLVTYARKRPKHLVEGANRSHSSKV